uniref:B30.2/SPRY domain-containing protein n=1 Tax=Globodera pallida TaxID=36090 RepID=A0A183C0H7_GLOPA
MSIPDKRKFTKTLQSYFCIVSEQQAAAIAAADADIEQDEECNNPTTTEAVPPDLCTFGVILRRAQTELQMYLEITPGELRRRWIQQEARNHRGSWALANAGQYHFTIIEKAAAREEEDAKFKKERRALQLRSLRAKAEKEEAAAVLAKQRLSVVANTLRKKRRFRHHKDTLIYGQENLVKAVAFSDSDSDDTEVLTRAALPSPIYQLQFLTNGRIKSDDDAWRSVRAEWAIPKGKFGIYYYEVTILEIANDIHIGLTTKQMPLDKWLGWNEGTYAYDSYGRFWGHAVAGCSHTTNERPYMEGKPEFEEGDVIGCGVNLATRQIIYTKNGQRLGMAAQHVVLGSKLKARYIDELKFVNACYLNKEIYVRSTDMNRTLTSAISNMIGFYCSGVPEKDYPRKKEAHLWPHRNFWLVAGALFIEDLYRSELPYPMPEWTQNKTMREEIRKVNCLLDEWTNEKGISAWRAFNLTSNCLGSEAGQCFGYNRQHAKQTAGLYPQKFDQLVLIHLGKHMASFEEITRNITGCETNCTLARFIERSTIFKPVPSPDEYCKDTHFPNSSC